MSCTVEMQSYPEGQVRGYAGGWTLVRVGEWVWDEGREYVIGFEFGVGGKGWRTCISTDVAACCDAAAEEGVVEGCALCDERVGRGEFIAGAGSSGCEFGWDIGRRVGRDSQGGDQT
jgi:hypothetical protein